MARSQRRSASRHFTTLRHLLCAACLAFGPAAAAQNCEPTTRIKSLLLTDTVDMLPVATLEPSLTIARETFGDDEHDLYEFDAELGFSERVQLKAEWDQRRLPNGVIDDALTASAAYRLVCRPGLPVLRIDVGFHHNGGNGFISRLLAGQRFAFGSWQAGVTRNDAINSTRYSGALLFDELRFPVVVEARADDTDLGWDRWFGTAFYLLSVSHVDLGVGWASGAGVSEDEERVMVRVTVAF